MIRYEEARASVLAEVAPLDGERVALAELGGRVLREPVTAPLDLPPFDNSAIDGYAVRTPAVGPLRVVGEVAAGDDARTRSIEAGEAARVFTGAALPAGADAVVMQEDVVREGDRILLNESVRSGDHVRRRGEEVRQGEEVLPAGLAVTPAVVGVLATLGLDRVEVYRRPRVTVIETGNELTEPGLPLAPGGVYAANGVALAAAAEALGAIVRVRRAGDDADELFAAFREALVEADMVVTSGGVSVGDHDLVRPTWERMRVASKFWRVAIKPGKPVYFGRSEGGVPIFGLPGNPVSSLVTFHLFVRPALLAMQGRHDAFPMELTAGTDLRGSEGRDEFVRVVVRDGAAYPLERQGSHMASGLALAQALVRLPAGALRVPAGSKVTALPLDWAAGFGTMPSSP